MADQKSDEQLTEARRLIERAHTEVGTLAKEGPRRWRMSIPAQPDRDSDLILSAGLKAGEDALAEVERLRAELARWEGHDAVTATLVKQAENERDAARAEAEKLRDQIKAGKQYLEWVEGQRRKDAAERDRLTEQAERDRASIVRLAQSWARHGKGAIAAELLTEFEMDEGEVLGEAGQ